MATVFQIARHNSDILVYFVLQLVDTTVEIANKVGSSEIIGRVVDDLKDENEQYRKMVLETIEKVSITIYLYF